MTRPASDPFRQEPIRDFVDMTQRGERQLDKDGMRGVLDAVAKAQRESDQDRVVLVHFATEKAAECIRHGPPCMFISLPCHPACPHPALFCFCGGPLTSLP